MKCYTHQEIDAVGVCSVCSQGICEPCSVKLGGKLFCKNDADKAFEKRSSDSIRDTQTPVKVSSTRGLPISIVSILFYVLGFFIIAMFFFGISVGVEIDLLTGYAIIIGVLDIFAGNWLWKGLKKGGQLGIIILIIDLIVTSVLSYYESIAVLSEFDIMTSGFFIGVIVIMLVLLIIGWGKLKTNQFCPQCKTRISLEDDFCTSCGNKI